MEIGSSFFRGIPPACAMAEHRSRHWTAEQQAISVTTRAESWADCAKDNNHKQPGGSERIIRQSGKRTCYIQKSNSSLPAARQASLHYRDNGRISIAFPR